MSALKAAFGLKSAAGSPRRRRITSLRSRSFGVIAVVVIIPCILLSALGVYAYYRSWNNAQVVFGDAAYRRAGEIAGEVASVQALKLTPAELSRLQLAIVQAYGMGHPDGAWYTTLDELRYTGTLPPWAIRELETKGYAIGTQASPSPDPATGAKPGVDKVSSVPFADIVAWRLSAQDVRYYTGFVPSSTPITITAPLRRLAPIALFGGGLVVVLVLLGAVFLSRSVVRPVRRVAEASRRLAEGRGGEPVPLGGPREIRELATAFNDMDAQLAKAQEAEQAFLLSVSHELKTPLTSIRGYAEGLDDGALPAAEAAAVIGAESSRLERLVGDLLDLARMRKSAFSVRREPVDLAAATAEVGNRYEATARDAGLTLTVQSREASFAVGDHDRVVQVISNLVENAIRSTPAAGTVSVTAAPGRVAVADTGLGLTSDDLPRAFERFYLYSRHRADRRVGTGLGLAIVKELTEAMGGHMTVTSTVGVGTTFVVSLPLVMAGEPPAHGADEPADADATGKPAEFAATDAPAATPEAIAADDDADINEATEALLPATIHVIDLEAPAGQEPPADSAPAEPATIVTGSADDAEGDDQ